MHQEDGCLPGILGLPEELARTSLTKSTPYRTESTGEFSRRFRLSVIPINRHLIEDGLVKLALGRHVLQPARVAPINGKSVRDPIVAANAAKIAATIHGDQLVGRTFGLSTGTAQDMDWRLQISSSRLLWETIEGTSARIPANRKTIASTENGVVLLAIVSGNEALTAEFDADESRPQSGCPGSLQVACRD